MRRGRGGKEKEEWIGCVQSDVRTFRITGDLKAMALFEEGAWVERKGRVRGLWAAWGEKKESCYRARKRRTFEATPFGLVDEPKAKPVRARGGSRPE